MILSLILFLSLTGLKLTSCQAEKFQNDFQNETWLVTSEDNLPINLLRRSLHNKLEILVLITESMNAFHGRNLLTYIKQIFAQVQRSFRHPTLGAYIDVILVGMKKVDYELFANHTGEENLSFFCDWVYEQDLPHFDIPVLITRNRVSEKVTLGSSHIGSVCEKYLNCVIIVDDGLSMAITLTHELGHILSMEHDNSEFCKDFPVTTENTIMRDKRVYAQSYEWSDCSRNRLVTYLNLNQTNCLLDDPKPVLYWPAKTSETEVFKLLGLFLSRDRQCKLSGYTGYRNDTWSTCRRYCCDSTECKFLDSGSFIDGTECGIDDWCYQGQCQALRDSIKEPIDGGWGDWISAGNCSRSCGGGLQKMIRYCSSPAPANGGVYCLGDVFQYRTCNQHNCPESNTLNLLIDSCDQAVSLEKVLLREEIGEIPADYDVHAYPSFANTNNNCSTECEFLSSEGAERRFVNLIDGTNCSASSLEHSICLNGECIVTRKKL